MNDGPACRTQAVMTVCDGVVLFSGQAGPQTRLHAPPLPPARVAAARERPTIGRTRTGPAPLGTVASQYRTFAKLAFAFPRCNRSQGVDRDTSEAHPLFSDVTHCPDPQAADTPRLGRGRNRPNRAGARTLLTKRAEKSPSFYTYTSSYRASTPGYRMFVIRILRLWGLRRAEAPGVVPCARTTCRPDHRPGVARSFPARWWSIPGPRLAPDHRPSPSPRSSPRHANRRHPACRS